MKKKVLLFLFIFVLLFSFAGCKRNNQQGNGGEGQGEGQGQTEEKVVAKIAADKQGLYYGDDVVVEVLESKVKITDPTGKTEEYTLYQDKDGKIYVEEDDEKVYCTFGDGTVTNKHGTFAKKASTPDEVLVSSIDASSDGEDFTGEGSLASPYAFALAQGQSLKATLLISPSNADNKELDVKVGKIENGSFEEVSNTGLSAAIANGKVTFTASEDIAGGDYAVCLITKDGSNKSLYFKASVTAFVDVTDISVAALKPCEEEGFDYEYTTLLGTHWDITKGITLRGQGLLDGTVGYGGLQTPRNLTYYPCVYNLDISVSPADASNAELKFETSNADVFVVKNGGVFEVKGAGEATITISSLSNPDVSVKIKVTVLNAIYPGIDQTEYAAATASGITDWNMDQWDNNPDAQTAAYDDWHMVMMQCNYSIPECGIDHNQKIFYMGSTDRPYGICLENGFGYYATGGGELADVTSPCILTEAASLIWAKITIPSGAEELKFKISSNSKTKYISKFRVVFVAEDGTVTALLNGEGEEFTPINQQADAFPSYVIPEALRGQTGALVVEHYLNEQHDNAEFQIKRIYFSGYTPVSSVALESDSTTLQPGGSVQILPKINPQDASNKALTFEILENKTGITVDASGKVTVDEACEDGEFVIRVKSVDNPEKYADYTLTVSNNEIYVTKWGSKSEILNGVSGLAWEVVGKIDAGVGEGADLHVDGANGWSSLKLADRLVKQGYQYMTINARVFVRGGETNPRIVIKVTYGEEETIIKAIGTDLDYVELDTLNKRYDSYNYFTYDLSAFIGKKVTIEVGIIVGTHCAVNGIEFGDGTVIPTTSVTINAGGDATVSIYESTVAEKDKVYTLHDYVNKGATNGFVTLALATETEYAILEGHTLTIKAGAPAGEYKVVATSVANPEVKGEFVVIVEADPVEIPDPTVWANKAAILEDWTVNGKWESGVGEGVDLHVDGTDGWSSIVLDNREIKSCSYVLNMGARVFVRGGETNPRFVVKVTTDKGNVYIIRANGASEDYVELDTTDSKYDSPNHYYYDLSQFIGMTVKVEIGVTQGTHSVITDLRFDGNENIVWGVKGQQGKKAMIIGDDAKDPWVIVGNQDAGVGEGADIKGTGSYLKNTISVGNYYNNILTFQGRVFHRDGETYPEISLIVIDGNEEIVVRAQGASEDYVAFDQDNLATFSYDLSAFAGKTVEVRIQLHNNATHCVIAYIGLEGSGEFTDIDPYVFVWNGKQAIIDGWELVGKMDSGVGEGADLHVDGTDGWSAFKLEEREIRNSSYALKIGARVFVRGGETNPRFVLKVTSELGNEYIIRANGASEDYVEFDTTDSKYDSTNYIYYDLSQFIGQTVTIEFGVTQGTHSVVQYIGFSGDENIVWGVKGQQGKKDMILGEDKWVVVGNQDAGVGEGADIKGTGSYLKNNITVGNFYNNILTFQGRVFHRDGETYPEVSLIVIDGGEEIVVRTQGASEDYVAFDQDNLATFTYDLSAFAGKTIEVRIQLHNNATHCVIAYIGLEGSEKFHEVDPKKLEWNGKDAIVADWELVGKWDSGVGEGADLHVDGTDGWSAWKLEKAINESSYLLKVGARVFVRGGETNPRFVLKITVDGETTIVRAVGASEDYVEFDTTDSKYDSTNYMYYDLSAFMGKKVTIEFGVTQGTHSVVQSIKFSGMKSQEWGVKGQQGKKDMILGEGKWTIVGDQDAGVGEGADIKGTGSYLKNTIAVGANYNHELTFQGRVFHRDGETYPEVSLIVVDGNEEIVVRANDASEDYVYFDQDNLATFTYDLSAFAGKTVEVRIQLHNNATHCVIAYIEIK